MRHTFNASAYGFRLRPVELDDAEFIISLRADPVHARFLNPTSRSVPEQHAYLRKLFDRPGDFSFVLEHAVSRRPEGLVAICDVTDSPAQAEWGRWILRPGSLAAPIHAWLVYTIAFEQMKLDALCCRTVQANTTVVMFHDQFGLQRGRELPAYFHRGAESFDSIEHWLRAEDWPALKARHEPLLARLGKRLCAA